jgi:hypothetical protein
LPAVDPPGDTDKKGLPTLQNEIHGPPNATEEQKTAASGMMFGVPIGRKPSLIDLETPKNYRSFIILRGVVSQSLRCNPDYS